MKACRRAIAFIKDGWWGRGWVGLSGERSRAGRWAIALSLHKHAGPLHCAPCPCPAYPRRRTRSQVAVGMQPPSSPLPTTTRFAHLPPPPSGIERQPSAAALTRCPPFNLPVPPANTLLPPPPSPLRRRWLWASTFIPPHAASKPADRAVCSSAISLSMQMPRRYAPLLPLYPLQPKLRLPPRHPNKPVPGK